MDVVTTSFSSQLLLAPSMIMPAPPSTPAITHNQPKTVILQFLLSLQRTREHKASHTLPQTEQEPPPPFPLFLRQRKTSVWSQFSAVYLLPYGVYVSKTVADVLRSASRYSYWAEAVWARDLFGVFFEGVFDVWAA